MSATATYTAPGTLTPVLSDLWDRERSWTLRTYLDHGGYEGLKRAKSLSPEELMSSCLPMRIAFLHFLPLSFVCHPS